MDELVACPYCGGEAREFTDATIPDGKKYAHCAGLHKPDVMCPNDAIMPVEQWNTRPIEDALRAELAAKDAEIERLREVISALPEWTYGDNINSRCVLCDVEWPGPHERDCYFANEWEDRSHETT